MAAATLLRRGASRLMATTVAAAIRPAVASRALATAAPTAPGPLTSLHTLTDEEKMLQSAGMHCDKHGIRGGTGQLSARSGREIAGPS